MEVRAENHIFSSKKQKKKKKACALELLLFLNFPDTSDSGPF